MPVRVLFFGATADISGQREIVIDAEGSTTSQSVFEQILSQYPALSAHRLLYSLNQKYATGDEMVSEGDELAIFTAVSGG